MAKDWRGGTASTFKTIGASNHCDHPRADKDYYATEPAATEWLTKIEQLTSPILEPSCGEGHISRVLMDAGYRVESRDLADRGFGKIADFLSDDNTEWNGDIVTNPPYAFAQEFVEKALSIIPPGRKVAMFLKLTFLEGKKRAILFEKYPPPKGMGQSCKAKVCYERRFREHRRFCHSLRMVCMGKGLSGRS